MKDLIKKLYLIPFQWKEISKDPLIFFTSRTVKGDQLLEIELFPHIKTFIIRKPEHIEQVLVKNNRSYIKSKAYKFLKIVLGNGLLTSEGGFWRRQRRIAQPAFHRQVLASFTNEIKQLVDNLINKWKASIKDGSIELNVANEMMKLTVSITANLLFGADISEKEDKIVFLVGDINERTSSIIKTPLPIPLWAPTSNNLIFKKHITELDIIINDIIEKRRKHPEAKREDLLQMLMDAVDEETGEKMNDIQLKDEVMTLFLAGSETSSNALAWTLFLLSKFPEEKKKVLDEINLLHQQRVEGLDALKRLSYLNMVMQESLRIYPPAWIIAREAVKEDEIDGIKIPVGSQVYISVHGMQKHPYHWQEPEKFFPERFLDNNRPKYSYFPFGGGPRLCIGAELARMEVLLSLFRLLQEFDFSNLKNEVVPEALITLRPKDGLQQKITLRNKNL